MQLRHLQQKQRVCSDQSTYLFTQAMLLSHAAHQTKLYIKVSEHLLSSKHGHLSCKVTYMLFHSGMQYVVLEHSGRRLQTCWMMECFCAGGKHRLAITLWPSGLLCFLFRSLCWSCDITTFLTCNLFLLLFIYIYIFYQDALHTGTFLNVISVVHWLSHWNKKWPNRCVCSGWRSWSL